MLETMAFENGLSTQLIKAKPTISEYEFEPTQSPQQVPIFPYFIFLWIITYCIGNYVLLKFHILIKNAISWNTLKFQETLDALCDLYSLLKEEDMLVGLWQKRAKFQETNTALAYEQHGFFEQAQQAYEQVAPLF